MGADRDFVTEVRAILGWEGLEEPPTEAQLLAEIRRLRALDEAPDEERDPPVGDPLENLKVESVNRVGGDPIPGVVALWLTTQAGTIETHSQYRGRPWRTNLVENPRKHLHLWLTTDQGVKLREAIDEQLGAEG
jgi:hypothetical protein